MDEKDKQSVLGKLSGTGIAGGLGGAALLAAIGQAVRSSADPGEEHSILSNPILLGALGAGIGYAGGDAIDRIKTPNAVKGSISGNNIDNILGGTGKVLSGTGKVLNATLSPEGALATGGLYLTGALANRLNAGETIQKFIGTRGFYGSLTQEELKGLVAKLPPKDKVKLVKALARRGRTAELMGNKELSSIATKIGVLGDKGAFRPLRNFLTRNAFGPLGAIRGLLYDAPIRAFRNAPIGYKITKGLVNNIKANGFKKALKPLVTKKNLKRSGRLAGKAAPFAAALAGLAMLASGSSED